jgi:hypothetical protein
MLSEIDLRDWERTDEAVKLYEVPRNSVVSPVSNPSDLVYFDHLDGAYSYCIDLIQRDVVHLAAWADVHVWKRK